MDRRPPDDFMCPLSRELMSDPVILCTGQTYDRSSIQQWFESGKHICPNTKLHLHDTDLIPNYALRNLISQWKLGAHWPQTPSAELKPPAISDGAERHTSKAPAHETLKNIEILLKALANTTSKKKALVQSRRDAIFEIRTLARKNREARLQIVEAGAVTRIIPLLSCRDSVTQKIAMRALFYLSLDYDNKVGRVPEGVLDWIVNALKHGSMDARATAAETLNRWAIVDVNEATIGSHPDAIGALVRLFVEGDAHASARKQATSALHSLFFNKDNMKRAVMAGAVIPLLKAVVNSVGVLNESVERPLSLLNMLTVISEGQAALDLEEGIMESMVKVLREGTFRSREHAVAILSSLCCNSWQRAVEAREAGVMEHCNQMLEDGSPQTKRKVLVLMNVLRGADNHDSGS